MEVNHWRVISLVALYRGWGLRLYNVYVRLILSDFEDIMGGSLMRIVISIGEAFSTESSISNLVQSRPILIFKDFLISQGQLLLNLLLICRVLVHVVLKIDKVKSI